MIIVRLQGGLGNQMFQCAVGVAAARRRNETAKLDVTMLNRRTAATTPREYALGCFAEPLPLAEPEEIALFQWRDELTLAGRARQRIERWWRPRRIYQQHGAGYDDGWASLRGALCLDGYWQGAQYVAGIEDEMHRRFRFRQPLSQESDALAQAIRSHHVPAFVHVRRGDYISDPATHQFHGVCDADYYRQGIALLRRRGAEAFFVFSDDPQWCEAAFADVPAVTVAGPGPASEHLQLMALCHHAVIANSSFSWWAAWLIPHEDKCIVAPERWFGDEQANREAGAIVPPTWIRI